MIPLKINSKNLCEIFEPNVDFTNYTDAQIKRYSIEHQMYPTEVKLSSEQYSRDAERTADYELETLTIVNAKAKPEFTWSIIKATYVKNLLDFLVYKYNFKSPITDEIIPVEAADILVTYWDFNGQRTIHSYLGQTLDGTLVEYRQYNPNTQLNEDVLYWENFRIAFPER